MRRSIVVVLGSVLVVACTSTTGVDTTTSTAFDSTPTSTTTTAVPSPTTTVPPTTTTTLLVESEPLDLGPLAARGGHSVVWTGAEMIVWGGEADELGSELFADGAAFDLEAREWRLIADSPLSPRRYHVAAWTDEEMLIIGGLGGLDGGAYNPTTDTWRPIASPPIPVRGPGGVGPEGYVGAVWTGEELVVWLVQSDEAAAYDPAADSWRVLPGLELDADNGALRWDGENVYAFGTEIFNPPNPEVMSIARLVEDEWERLPDTDRGFSALAQLSAWTGERFLVWSDSGDSGPQMTFDPTTDSWSPADAPVGASCEVHGEPVAGLGKVFTFSWCGRTIGVHDTETDTWNEAAVDGAPTARYAVWTGEQLIVWGDTCCYGTGGQPFSTVAWMYEPDS